MKAPKTTEVMATGAPTEQPDLLHQKAELATRAVDSLMFSGEVGGMLTAMAAMAGIPAVSVSLIFPTKKPGNMRPFLASVNWILSTVLDDQCDLSAFTVQLAEVIKAIQRIAEEEK